MKLSREVKTGFVAIIIFALAIWGFNFLKGKNIFKPTNEYYVVFDDISGVIESGYVYYRGYNIGNITDLTFDPNTPGQFVVQFIVDKAIKIPNNSVITAIQSSLIASTKDLELVFGDSDEFHENGDTLIAGYDKGLMGALEPVQKDLEETIKSLKLTLEAISNTFDEETQARLKSSIASLDKSMASVSTLVAPNGSLRHTLKNVESITGNLKNKNDEISSSIGHLSNVSAALDSANLQSTMIKLDSTLAATASIMAKINKSEGTAGLLINDSALYINLAAATASLDTLLSDLEENPKKYVHFSLFGGKKDK